MRLDSLIYMLELKINLWYSSSKRAKNLNKTWSHHKTASKKTHPHSQGTELDYNKKMQRQDLLDDKDYEPRRNKRENLMMINKIKTINL
jgi:hypothetical protein